MSEIQDRAEREPFEPSAARAIGLTGENVSESSAHGTVTEFTANDGRPSASTALGATRFSELRVIGLRPSRPACQQ